MTIATALILVGIFGLNIIGGVILYYFIKSTRNSQVRTGPSRITLPKLVSSDNRQFKVQRIGRVDLKDLMIRLDIYEIKDVDSDIAFQIAVTDDGYIVNLWHN